MATCYRDVEVRRKGGSCGNLRRGFARLPSPPPSFTPANTNLSQKCMRALLSSINSDDIENLMNPSHGSLFKGAVDISLYELQAYAMHI